MVAAAAHLINTFFTESTERLSCAGFDFYQIAMIHAIGIALIGVVAAFVMQSIGLGVLFIVLLLLAVLGYYIAHRHRELVPLQGIVTGLREQHAAQNTEFTGRISALSGEVTTLQSANESLRGTIATLEERWEFYNRSHTEHIATLTTIAGAIGEKTGELRTLTEQLSSIRGDIVLEQQRLAEIRGSLMGQVNLLRGISGTLGTQVAAIPQLTDLLRALQNVVAHLEPLSSNSQPAVE